MNYVGWRFYCDADRTENPILSDCSRRNNTFMCEHVLDYHHRQTQQNIHCITDIIIIDMPHISDSLIKILIARPCGCRMLWLRWWWCWCWWFWSCRRFRMNDNILIQPNRLRTSYVGIVPIYIDERRDFSGTGTCWEGFWIFYGRVINLDSLPSSPTTARRLYCVMLCPTHSRRLSASESSDRDGKGSRSRPYRTCWLTVTNGLNWPKSVST